MKEETYLDRQQNNKFKKFLAWLKKDQRKKFKDGTKNKKVSYNIFITQKVCTNCQIGEPIPNDTWCANCRSVD